MSKWTEDKVEKLKEYVEHRDYVVMLRRGNDTIAKVTPVNEVPNPEQYECFGWFGFGPRGYGDEVEDTHELDDYKPEDFVVYRALEDWDKYVVRETEFEEQTS